METKTFQSIADRLLQRHYGIGLGDTLLADEAVVKSYLESNTRPFSAVNDWVEEVDLKRVDKHGPWGTPTNIALTQDDESHVMASFAKPSPLKYRSSGPSL